MKTTEELNALKEEIISIQKKLAELTDDELKEVTGGAYPQYPGPHFVYPVKPQVPEPPIIP